MLSCIIRFKHVFIPFLLAVALLGCSDRDKDLYTKAQALWIADRYNEAVSKLLVITELGTNEKYVSESLFRLGEIHYLNLDMPDKALDFFHMAELRKEEPKIVRSSLEYIAQIELVTNQNYDGAILQYQKIIDTFSDKINVDEYLFKIGEVYMNKGDYSQAAIEFASLINRFPKSKLVFDADYEIAVSYFIKGDSGEALKRFDALLNQKSDHKYDYDIKLSRAICFEDLGKLKQALTQYEELLADYPDKQVLKKKIESVRHRTTRKVS